MKKITSLLLTFLSLSAVAQINVGPKEWVTVKNKEFDKEKLEELRATETIFVYQNSDKENLETFKKTLNEAWDYTPLKFVSYDEFVEGEWNEDEHSFFSINGLHKVKISSSGTVTEKTYLNLLLYMFDGGEKEVFARVNLFPTAETYRKASEFAEDDINELARYAYEESEFRNWNLAYLKNALQTIDKYISKGQNRWLFASENTSEVKKLKKEVLYVTEEFLIETNRYNMKDSKPASKEELFSKYPYKIKVVTQKELDEMVVNAKEPIYYIQYIKANTDQFINVINGESGDIIYAEYTGMAHKLKSKDLKKLAKVISKA